MNKSEKYIDIDGQELTKTTLDNGTTSYHNPKAQLHRLDGPALIYPDGSEYWYKDGKRHRLDGPAVIDSDGYQAWYKDDKLHRLDGPAVIEPSGTQKWYNDGELHREDGPAVVYTNGEEAYYLEGVEYSKDDYYKKINKSNSELNISITKENNSIIIKINLDK